MAEAPDPSSCSSLEKYQATEKQEMFALKEDEHSLHTLVFGIFGFVLQVFFSIGIAASQDILEATLVPTPVLLICASLPYFLVTSIIPYFVLKLKQKVLLVPIVFLSIAGVLLFALVDHLLVRVTGVIFVSTGVAIGEVTFVSMTALYSDVSMSSYATGTGIGFIAGPLYYTAMTTLICVPPEATILVICWVPLMIFVFYAIIEKRQFKPAQDVTTHKDVTYSSLDQQPTQDKDNSPPSEKRTLIWRNLQLMIACLVGYFSEFLTLNGVITTLAFPNSPFDPRNHFVYYACVFMIGECIGRSYITLLLLLGSKCMLVITKTWILSTMLSSLFIFLTLASWYRFIHSVWVVLLVIFIVGILAGNLYLNTFLMASGTKDDQGKAFSRAFLSVGPSTGVLLAGLVGLVLEPRLREHCLHSAEFYEFCFTRSMSGWNKTTSCIR